MEIEAARYNMISQQIRACDVLDEHLLDILRQTPREEFVPAELKKLAFSDMRLPIGHGQTMMSPVEESKILQALRITENDNILEIGTGTGYMTALLAKLGKQVTSIDIIPEFTHKATKLLTQMQINNVNFLTQDAVDNWGPHAPYDVICVSGSIPEASQSLRSQLTQGGRLFVIVGDAPAMQATLTERTLESHWAETVLFETTISPLIHAVKREPFTF